MPFSTAWLTSQLNIFWTSCSFIEKLSQFLTADSSKTLIEYGSRSSKKSPIYMLLQHWNHTYCIVPLRLLRRSKSIHDHQHSMFLSTYCMDFFLWNKEKFKTPILPTFSVILRPLIAKQEIVVKSINGLFYSFSSEFKLLATEEKIIKNSWLSFGLS